MSGTKEQTVRALMRMIEIGAGPEARAAAEQKQREDEEALNAGCVFAFFCGMREGENAFLMEVVRDMMDHGGHKIPPPRIVETDPPKTPVRP